MDWQAAATRVEHDAALAFLLMLLAACLAILGVQLQHAGVLMAAKGAAIGVALFEGVVAVAGTSLVVRAWRHVRARWLHVRRSDIHALRRTVLQSARLALLAWPLAAAALCLPVVIDLPARVPTTGLVFAPLLVVFGLQWAHAWSYRLLAVAVMQSHDFPRVCAVTV